MYLYERWFYKKEELCKELHRLIVVDLEETSMSKARSTMNTHLRELLNHPIWASIKKRERILIDHIHMFTANGIESECFHSLSVIFLSIIPQCSFALYLHITNLIDQMNNGCSMWSQTNMWMRKSLVKWTIIIGTNLSLLFTSKFHDRPNFKPRVLVWILRLRSACSRVGV